MSRLTLNLGLAAMEVCWLVPWAVLLGLWSDSSRSRQLLAPLSMVALVLLGSLTAQAFGRRAANTRALRFGLAGLGLLLTLLAVRVDQYPSSGGLEWCGLLLAALAAMLGQLSAPVLAFGLGLFLWWRGVRLGTQSASYSEVESAFRWGIGLLVTFALILGISTRPNLLPDIEGRTTPFVVAFFFFSLLTLALGRLESLRTRSRALTVNSQWFGVLVVVAGLVVLLALILGQLLSFDLLLVATRPLFDVLGQVLLLLAYAIVIPLAYVVELLIYFILSLVNPDPNRQPPQPFQTGDMDNLLQRFLSQYVSPELLGSLKAAGAALILGIALLVIARTLTRWRSSTADADDAGEERDSVWDAGAFKRAFLAWLHALFQRGSTPPPASTADLPPASGGVAIPARASIRDLYRRLLELGETAGAYRLPMTTPLEHLPSLQQVLQPKDALGRLTAAYLQARYAEQDASTDELAALRNHLGRVEPRDAPG